MKLGNAWDTLLNSEYEQPYFQRLLSEISTLYVHERVYPPRGKAFTALLTTPPERVKVVIIGQDPYHQPGQAMGLSFSVPQGVKLPPSLVNIYKELLFDLQGTPYNQALNIISGMSGDLTAWAQDGVLLLNSALTVIDSKPGVHKDLWAPFTDTVISTLQQNYSNIVFILWGSHAISKAKLIDSSRHLVLTSVHPSPLSAYGGFFGSRPFSKANEYLVAHGKAPVDWLRLL